MLLLFNGVNGPLAEGPISQAPVQLPWPPVTCGTVNANELPSQMAGGAATGLMEIGSAMVTVTVAVHSYRVVKEMSSRPKSFPLPPMFWFKIVMVADVEDPLYQIS